MLVEVDKAAIGPMTRTRKQYDEQKRAIYTRPVKDVGQDQ